MQAWVWYLYGVTDQPEADRFRALGHTDGLLLAESVQGQVRYHLSMVP